MEPFQWLFRALPTEGPMEVKGCGYTKSRLSTMIGSHFGPICMVSAKLVYDWVSTAASYIMDF